MLNVSFTVSHNLFFPPFIVHIIFRLISSYYLFLDFYVDLHMTVK